MSDKINLIPNASFEDENLCFKYEELCCPEAWRSTTLKGYYYLNDLNSKSGKNPAADGHRMVSLCMHSSKREFDRGFLQVPLLCPLEEGQAYELSFYYKAPYNMLESFGIHFLDSMHIQKDNRKLIGIQSKLSLRNKWKIPENTWIISKHTFVADGNEHFMMIGNFNTDEETKVIPLGGKRKRGSEASKITRTYHLFDHFVLSPVDAEVDCDLKKRNEEIYADNVRHTFPKKKPIKNENLITDKVEIVDVQRSEKTVEYLIIDTDSIQIEENFELPNILFDINSDQLLSVSYSTLNQLANYLIKNRQQKISITGHTDNQGKTLFNLSLSERRAKSVFEYLRNKGVQASRMTFTGKGEREPVSDNETEEGREKNRRVVFQLFSVE